MVRHWLTKLINNIGVAPTEGLGMMVSDKLALFYTDKIFLTSFTKVPWLHNALTSLSLFDITLESTPRFISKPKWSITQDRSQCCYLDMIVSTSFFIADQLQSHWFKTKQNIYYGIDLEVNYSKTTPSTQAQRLAQQNFSDAPQPRCSQVPPQRDKLTWNGCWVVGWCCYADWRCLLGVL